MTGGRLHLTKISTAEVGRRRSPPPRRAGSRSPAIPPPPYFALNDLAVGDYRTFGKLVPPLRAEDDREAIVEGLKSGVIDAIVSDHRPQDQDSKRVPFAQAEPGGIGLETLLPISLELVHNGHLTLPQLFQRLSSGAGAAVRPARRQARQGRAGRPGAVRRRLRLADRPRRSVEQDQELAVRRAAGAGPGDGDHRRRPHHLPP